MSVCSVCGIPAPAWPGGWLFDHSVVGAVDVYCPDHHRPEHRPAALRAAQRWEPPTVLVTTEQAQADPEGAAAYLAAAIGEITARWS